MHIDHIALKDFRTFRSTRIDFVHPDQDFARLGFDRPKYPNVNLLLGNNGFGKTTLLKAVALACLGPAVGKSGVFPYRLIRREPDDHPEQPSLARIEAAFTTHRQDRVAGAATPERLQALVEVRRQGDLEDLVWASQAQPGWEAIFSAESEALFFVGYGASRRVEHKERFDPGARRTRLFARAQRVQSLFEDTYSLVPLNGWLPEFARRNPGRHEQVVRLLNRLLGKGHYAFTGEMADGEYLFQRGGLTVPFPALSDGYRAYLGWVCDLLHHVCMTCPPGQKLVDSRGIVMLDEIDLHLHPKWQMTVIPTLALALPNLQFIVTSHSPLVVGSLQWQNIIGMRPVRDQASRLDRVPTAVHGLDADQVLLTTHFGLTSTRAQGRDRQLKELSMKARLGDPDAAEQLLAQMSQGTELAQ